MMNVIVATKSIFVTYRASLAFSSVASAGGSFFFPVLCKTTIPSFSFFLFSLFLSLISLLMRRLDRGVVGLLPHPWVCYVASKSPFDFAK